MPYAFAHPAAVIPLARALGSLAAPSALAIGAMVPDAWYLVPGLDRRHSHDAAGLFLFCLPAGLLAYYAFHLLLKQPLASLLPARLARRAMAFTTRGVPPASLAAVLVSLLAGAATHLAWDAFTHMGRLVRAMPFLQAELVAGLPLFRLLQHASTLAGTLVLAWWLSRKLKAAAPAAEAPSAPVATKVVMLGATAAAVAGAVAADLQGAGAADWPTLRVLLRHAAGEAGAAVCALAVVYSVGWKLSAPRSAGGWRRPR